MAGDVNMFLSGVVGQSCVAEIEVMIAGAIIGQFRLCFIYNAIASLNSLGPIADISGISMSMWELYMEVLILGIIH